MPSHMDEWHPPEREMPTGPESFPATGVNSLSTFGQRGAARIIDALLIGGPVLVAAFAVVYASGSADDSTATSLPLWAPIIWFVAAVVYETAMLAWKGQTLGKMALGIKVGNLADGRPPVWWQAAIRTALPAAAAGLDLPVAVAVYAGIYSTATWDPMRRGFHDKAGGTVVVASR